jgi:hypothetical protein
MNMFPIRSQSKYLMNCLLAGKVWSREERLQSLDSISLPELIEFAKEGNSPSQSLKDFRPP